MRKLRKEIRKILLIDTEFKRILETDKSYRKRIIRELIDTPKYQSLVGKLSIKYIDIKFYYLEQNEYMYINNSAAFYRLRESEIEFIYDFIFIVNKYQNKTYVHEVDKIIESKKQIPLF